MLLTVSEILENADRMPSDEERILYLQNHRISAIKDVLATIHREDLIWQLPEGKVPYNPMPSSEAQGVLYRSSRLFYLFIDGPNGHQGLQDGSMQTRAKRESKFVELIESVDPKDAEMLIKIKDKINPYENITEDVVRAAFPDILPPKVELKGELEEENG